MVIGARSQVQRVRLARFVLVVLGAGMVVAFPGSSRAQVLTVKGGAYGYSAQISLFGSAQPADGPTPTVTLPATGSATPITATAPSGLVRHGPATFFTSDRLDVSTQGTTGSGGSVTSSSNVANVNRSTTQPAQTGSEIFSADTVHSTCTASESGVTGSTTFANAVLRTDSGDDTAGDVHPAVDVAIPNNPAANYGPISGHLHVNGSQDNFHVLFNEQVTGADGSITVNAVHEFLDGPTATGELIIGQSACGATAPPVSTTVPSRCNPPAGPVSGLLYGLGLVDLARLVCQLGL